MLHEEFEHLGGGIYSFHIAIKNKNIRILYTLLGNNIILLLAFFERAGKSATDYTRKIEEANYRISELEEI